MKVSFVGTVFASSETRALHTHPDQGFLEGRNQEQSTTNTQEDRCVQTSESLGDLHTYFCIDANHGSSETPSRDN